MGPPLAPDDAMNMPTGLLRLLLLAAALLLASMPQARAGWNAAPELLRGLPTWLYQPATSMANGKHALLIVLHGCLQDHTNLKRFGNLEAGADAGGLVVALPSVGQRMWQGNPDARCWDYDGAFDQQGTIADMVKLARQLSGRPALNIDPNHIYVAGLSAGAALALAVACRGADVIAGVAAVAGPSVGSRQDFALNGQFAIPFTNVGNAVASCRELAGDKADSLSTQLANIAYGDMDANGSHERYPFFFLSRADWIAHGGQLSLISVRWSRDNAMALQLLYGIDHVDVPERVAGGDAAQQLSWRGGLPRLALMQLRDVGHAWPAGAAIGTPATEAIFIARRGLDYGAHVSRWLLANNVRGLLAPGPQITATATADGKTVLVTGRVQGEPATTIRIALLAADGRELARHARVPVAPDGSFSDRFEVDGDGPVELELMARGFRGATAVLSGPLQITN
jgi:poly(3-hydroxybutyrate) depolymerase